MPLNVSPLKPFKYPLLMLGQHLHRWLRRHRGRSTGLCSRVMRGSLSLSPPQPQPNPPSAHSDERRQMWSRVRLQERITRVEKSKLDIHSRSAFRACRPLTASESPRGGVGQEKQPAKQRPVRLSVRCNDCR